LKNNNNHGLRIARTVVWIHEIEYCPVWNDTNYPIHLKYITPVATVSTVQDKLKICSLEQSIQTYRDVMYKRGTRGINHLNSRHNRRHYY